MSTPTTQVTSTGGDVSERAAERHEREVVAILTEMHEERYLVDAVIDLAFELTLQRGETTPGARADFASWSRSVVKAARGGERPETEWSDDLDALLEEYLEIAGSADTTAASVADEVAEADGRLGGSLAAGERQVADLVAGVLTGSVTMWSEDGRATSKASSGIDGSQVARADVMGAITGAAGAAVATWWSGPVSGAAVAGATVTGAVLGSAVDAVLQDNANDALEDAEPTPSGP